MTEPVPARRLFGTDGIRGLTNTLPLHVELLFNDLNAAGAFAAATVLTMIALVVLHVAAALHHHLVRRDGVLLRMVPASRR